MSYAYTISCFRPQSSFQTIIFASSLQYSDDNSAVESVLEELAVTQDQDIQKKYKQLQQQCRQLESEKSDLKAEVQELRTKVGNSY